MSRYVKCLFLFKDYALKKGNKNHTCPYFEGHIEEQRRCVKTLPPWFSSHMNIIRKPSEIFNSKLDAKTRQNWGLLRILKFWGIFRCNNPELGCGWSVWFKSKGHFFDVCLGSHHIQNALWRSKEVSDRIAMYLWLPIRCYSQDKSSFKIYSPAYNIFVIVSLKFIMHDDMSWYIPTQLLLIYAKSYRFYFEKFPAVMFQKISLPFIVKILQGTESTSVVLAPLFFLPLPLIDSNEFCLAKSNWQS